ncbi:MAG: oligosaccharide flippase family protein [Candidatus Rokubacteria bacterium]|nr:oligosaccharide flippase family protein [Candidatus Rokubacteria bacterium]
MSRGASIREMVRHWAVYSAGAMASRVVGFLLVPVYTRYLTPADYGVLEMVTTTIHLVGIFVGFGMSTAVIRHYRDEAGEAHPEVISTGLFFSAGVTALGAGLAFTAAGPLAALTFGSGEFAHYVRLGLVGLFLSNCLEIPLAYFRAVKAPAVVVKASLVELVLTVVLNVVFIVGLGWGVDGVLWGNIIIRGLLFAVLGGRTLRAVGATLARDALARLVRYGAPTLPALAGWFVVNLADRLFVAWYGSLADVGIYSLASRFGTVILLLVVQPLRQVWEPLQFEVGRDARAARLFPRMFEAVVIVLVLAGFTLCLFVGDAIRVLTPPAFWPAADIVPLLVLCYVLAGVVEPFKTAILVTNRTWLMGLIAAALCGLNVGANLLLVPRLGASGAALARAATAAVEVIMTYWVSQRVHRIDFKARRPLRLLVYAAALLVVAQWVPREPAIVSLALRMALLAALGLLALRSLSLPGGYGDRIAALRASIAGLRGASRAATRGVPVVEGRALAAGAAEDH